MFEKIYKILNKIFSPKDSTVRFKLEILILFYLLIFLAVFLYSATVIIKNADMDHFQKMSTSSLSELNRRIKSEHELKESTLTTEIMQRVKNENNASEVLVVDKNYRIIYKSDTKRDIEYYRHKDIRVAMSEGRIVTEVEENEKGKDKKLHDTLDIAIPIFDVNGKIIGGAEAQYFLDGVYEEIFYKLKPIFYYSILIMLLAFLVTDLSLRLLIIKPLDRLRNGANEIAKGKYDARVEAGSFNDEFKELSVVINDMTKLLVAQIRFNESVIEYLPLGVIVSNTEGEVIKSNSIAKQYFDIKKDIYSIFDLEIVDQDSSLRKKLMAGIRGKSVTVEETNYYQGDSYSNYAWFIKPVMDNNGEVIEIICLIMDQTEKSNLIKEIAKRNRELEESNLKLTEAREHLVRTGKLSALGKLSAGIAHEISQPVSIIMGLSQINKLNESLDDNIVKDLDVIEEQTKRIGRIVSAIRIFAGEEKVEFNEVEVNKVIIDTLSVIKKQFDSTGIKINIDLAEDLPEINGSSDMLSQAFMQILINAQEALSIENKGPKEISIRTCLDENDKKITIYFEDNGAGISEEDMPRILDPFYSSESIGQRVGLGLSVTYGIINEHSGNLDILSKKNKGTTVKIILPIFTKSKQTIKAGC